MTFGQRALRAAQRRRKVWPVHDQLGQQAVVMRRRRHACLRMCVHAHTGAAGPGQMRDAAAGGQRMALRIQRFGVDAPLDGEAALRHRRAF